MKFVYYMLLDEKYSEVKVYNSLESKQTRVTSVYCGYFLIDYFVCSDAITFNNVDTREAYIKILLQIM